MKSNRQQQVNLTSVMPELPAFLRLMLAILSIALLLLVASRAAYSAERREIFINRAQHEAQLKAEADAGLMSKAVSKSIGFLKAQVTDFFNDDQNNDEQDDHVDYLFYDRIPNSPYLVTDKGIYWERVVTSARTCTFCTRSNVTWTYTDTAYYERVTAELDRDNLQGFGAKAPYLSDGKQLIIKTNLVPEVTFREDFDASKIHYAGPRSAFFVIDHLVFFKDQYQAHTDGREFTFINTNFYKDQRHVYDGENVIEGADPTTFEVVNYYFVQDKKHVWKHQRKLETTDIKPGLTRLQCQTRTESCEYAKNNEAVYYRDKLLEGADVASFDVLRLSCPPDEVFAANDDKALFPVANHPYLQCLLPAKGHRKNIKDDWAIDKNHVYYLGDIYPELDAKTTQRLSIGSEIMLIDDIQILHDRKDYQTAYQDFLAGPLTNDHYSNERWSILADSAGFFTLSNVFQTREAVFEMCDYAENQDKGALRIMDNKPTDIAYAFEDDLFIYHFKGAYGQDFEMLGPKWADRNRRKKTEDALAIKDYLIEKSTDTRYVLFKGYTGCGKWDEVSW